MQNRQTKQANKAATHNKHYGIDEDDDEIEEQYVDDAFDNNGEEVDD